MPVMDGYTAAGLIRKLDEKIPIVAMTADAIAGVEEKCREHGIYAYVSKPFEPEQLIETIFRLTKEKRAGKAAEEAPQDHSGAETLDTADGLKRLGGDLPIYRMVLQEFAKENRMVGREITRAISEADLKEAAQMAHKIKSSAGSIGANALRGTAAELQKALEANVTPEIERLKEEFTAALGSLLQTIEEYLQ